MFSDTDRAEAVWNLLQHDKLPREHYHNIQYLFRVTIPCTEQLLSMASQFLNEVARHEERNKMSPRYCNNVKLGKVTFYLAVTLRS